MPDTSESGFDIFSEETRSAFEASQQRAILAGAEHIMPEHLLLGLLEDPEGDVPGIIKSANADVDELRGRLESFAKSDAEPQSESPKLHPRSKEAIRTAVNQARLANLKRVDTVDLLIGLLRMQDGPVADMLRQIGLKLVRREVPNADESA